MSKWDLNSRGVKQDCERLKNNVLESISDLGKKKMQCSNDDNTTGHPSWATILSFLVIGNRSTQSWLYSQLVIAFMSLLACFPEIAKVINGER